MGRGQLSALFLAGVSMHPFVLAVCERVVFLLGRLSSSTPRVVESPIARELNCRLKVLAAPIISRIAEPIFLSSRQTRRGATSALMVATSS